MYEQGQKPNIEELRKIAADVQDPNLRHLSSEVSTKEVKTYTPHKAKGKVVVLDMGVKLNILRSFVNKNQN